MSKGEAANQVQRVSSGRAAKVMEIENATTLQVAARNRKESVEKVSVRMRMEVFCRV
jgi:translation initiation factor IF-1